MLRLGATGGGPPGDCDLLTPSAILLLSALCSAETRFIVTTGVEIVQGNKYFNGLFE